MYAVKRSVLVRDWSDRGRDILVGHRGFLPCEVTLYDTVMVDSCLYTFDQTHIVYNTKNEL